MSSDRQSPERIAEDIARGGLCDHMFFCDCLRDAIASALREAEARALREAAERIEHTSRPLVTQENVVAWLLQRAEQITAGSAEATKG